MRLRKRRLWRPFLRPAAGRKLLPELRADAKTLVADDFLSVAGSTNLDFRSFHFNAECNLVMLDRETARAFSEAFEADLAQSAEITPALWARRSLLHRMYDAFARGLGPFL